MCTKSRRDVQDGEADFVTAAREPILFGYDLKVADKEISERCGLRMALSVKKKSVKRKYHRSHTGDGKVGAKCNDAL